MKPHDNVKFALLTAATVSAVMALAKLVAFAMTGSLLVLGSFLDSLSDCFLSLINSRLRALSLEEADKEHPFGHGGIEVLASLAQGMIIAFFGLYLAYESITRFYRSEHDSELILTNLPLSAAVLIVSAAAAFSLHIYLRRQKEQIEDSNKRSLILISDDAHYAADGYTNSAAALGVAAVWLTGYHPLDAVFGLVGSAFLMKTAWPVLKGSMRDILHTEVPGDMQQEIVDIVYQVEKTIMGVHRLRTRQLGPTLFIDFHLKLPKDMPLHSAHDIGDRVQAAIKEHYADADVIIHLDPDNEPDDDIWTPSYNKPNPIDT